MTDDDHTPGAPVPEGAGPPLAAGLHRIAADDYHGDPAPAPSLSSSLARTLLTRSPRHAWWESPRLNPDWKPVEKPHFDVGRAAHRAVLGAGADFVVIPEGYLATNGAASTKEAKRFIAEAREEGLTPIKPEVGDQVEAMAAAIRGRLSAMGIEFAPARSEITALAEIDDVWCRAMIDNAPEDPRLPLYDLKTTTDASPDAVIRAIENYGYDVQAAHYLDTWQAATGERRRFRFVFVEKEPPHEVTVAELHDDPEDEADWMLDARSKVAEARRIWLECLQAGEWPGFPARVAVLGARGFFRQRWADRPLGEPVIQRPSAGALRAAAEAQRPQPPHQQ